ncbi:MAG: nucleotide exchange factor GrpE [Lachnospiraceae bacterium]|nr:nucleotide exchange factor GrpE [Lachnospiraceae bacterium]
MSDELKKDVGDNLDTEEVLQGEGDAQEALNTEEQEETAEPIAGSEESEGEEAAESKADKKAAKKKQKADKKQDALKEKIEELEDRVKRQMAEFDNFRKRTEKEKTAMFETGAKSVIEKILPVVDNFERGLATVPEEEKNSPFAEGMEMIYKQLISELEKMEVKPIPAVGEEFNPEFHNAVMQVESEEYESGVIAQELQKGYTYRDSVVRHSMVAVVS